MQFSGNPLWLLAGICLSTLAFLALGYLLASLIPTASAATVVGNVLLMPMLFLSGITVPLELMPETVQNISRFIPLTCVATLLRGLWFGEPVSSYLFEVAILGGTLVVATVLAANLNHLQGTQDKPAGTLPALRPDATHAKPNAGKGSAKYGRSVGGPILGKKLRWSFKIAGGYHHPISFTYDALSEFSIGTTSLSKRVIGHIRQLASMKPGQVARWKTRRWASAEFLCRKYGHSRLRPYIGQSILAGIILPMTDSVPAHQIAPLAKRFVAFFFDYALIAAYLVVLLAVGFGLTVLTGPLPIPSPWVTELIAFSTTVLPVILYFALQEGGAAQATWGKRRAGIRVKAVTNQPITYRQAFVRAIIKFAPWQLAHTSLIHIPGWPLAVEMVGTVSMVGLVVAQGLVLLYILCLLLSPTRRTPYDWGAGTVVVAEN